MRTTHAPNVTVMRMPPWSNMHKALKGLVRRMLTASHPICSNARWMTSTCTTLDPCCGRWAIHRQQHTVPVHVLPHRKAEVHTTSGPHGHHDSGERPCRPIIGLPVFGDPDCLIGLSRSNTQLRSGLHIAPAHRVAHVLESIRVITDGVPRAHLHASPLKLIARSSWWHKRGTQVQVSSCDRVGCGMHNNLKTMPAGPQSLLANIGTGGLSMSCRALPPLTTFR